MFGSELKYYGAAQRFGALHAAAVVNRTRRFCRHAATHNPLSKCVLPVPHSPISKTGSARSM